MQCGPEPRTAIAVRRADVDLDDAPATAFELAAFPEHVRAIVCGSTARVIVRGMPRELLLDVALLPLLAGMAAAWRTERVCFAACLHSVGGHFKQSRSIYDVFPSGDWERRTFYGGRLTDETECARAERAFRGGLRVTDVVVPLGPVSARLLQDVLGQPAGSIAELEDRGAWVIARRDLFVIGRGQMPSLESIGAFGRGAAAPEIELRAVALDALATRVLVSAANHVAPPSGRVRSLSRGALLADAARAFHLAFPERAETLLAELDRRLPKEADESRR